MKRAPWLSLLSLALLPTLACAPGGEADAGPDTDAGDEARDAGSGGEDDAGGPGGDDDAGGPGGDDDAGPGDAGPGEFNHPTSGSVAEVVYSWSSDDAGGISARMKDGTTLALLDETAFFDVSPDGRLLGYEKDNDLWVKPTSGGQPTLVFDNPTDLLSSFRFSPDGSVVFVSGNGHNGIAKSDGSFQSESLGSWGFNAPLVFFSPDSSAVLLAGTDGLGAYSNATMFSTDDGSTISTIGTIHGAPQWAPDSSAAYIAVGSDALQCTGDVLRVAKAGGAPTTVASCTSSHTFALAPDGARLAYLEAEDLGSTQDNMFLTDAATGENDVEVVGDDYDPGALFWLPDGSGIVYFDGSAGFPLRRVNPDGTNDIQLAQVDSAYPAVLGISPDGSSVAYEVLVAGVRTLYIADPDTADSAVVVLADNGLGSSYNIRWAATEPCLAFLRNAPDSYDGIAHVVGRAGACSLVPSGTSRGAVPASFDSDTDVSDGVAFAGGAVISRVRDDPSLYRDDASGSTDIAPAEATYIENAVAIDRFVGTGSDEEPERVRVHAVTSFVGF